MGPSTINKNSHEVSIRMPEGEDDERIEGSDSVEDDETTQETGVEANDEHDFSFVKSMRKIGIEPPKHLDTKKDRNFETWLERTDFHLAVNECAEKIKQELCYFF